MFKDWENFKVSVEASKAPELMLIVDKWEQLQFVSREYFSKYENISTYELLLRQFEAPPSSIQTPFINSKPLLHHFKPPFINSKPTLHQFKAPSSIQSPPFINSKPLHQFKAHPSSIQSPPFINSEPIFHQFKAHFSSIQSPPHQFKAPFINSKPILHLPLKIAPLLQFNYTDSDRWPWSSEFPRIAYGFIATPAPQMESIKVTYCGSLAMVCIVSTAKLYGR